MKEFIHKWSNWWILQPKRKQLDDAFEKELNELIEREVALRQLPPFTQNENPFKPINSKTNVSIIKCNRLFKQRK